MKRNENKASGDSALPSGDPLIDEIRAIRKQISAECGHDLSRLIERLREIERAHGARVIKPVHLPEEQVD